MSSIAKFFYESSFRSLVLISRKSVCFMHPSRRCKRLALMVALIQENGARPVFERNGMAQ